MALGHTVALATPTKSAAKVMAKCFGSQPNLAKAA